MHLVETALRQRCASSSRLSLVAPRTANAAALPVSGGLTGRVLGLLRGLWNAAELHVRIKPRRNELRVIETLQLGAKRQVVLLSCKGERFLIGTGADSVSTIVRLRPSSAEDAVAPLGAGGPRTLGDWS